MSALVENGGFSRTMTGIVVAGLVAGALAFVPSPFGVLDLFQSVPVLDVKPPPVLRMQPVPSIESYDLISLRPLFNPDRLPDPVPPRVATGPGAITAPALGDLTHFRLVGLAGDSQIQLALIQKSGGPVSTMKPGDMLDGWTIDRITAAGVSISGGGRKEFLTIPKAQNASTPP